MHTLHDWWILIKVEYHYRRSQRILAKLDQLNKEIEIRQKQINKLALKLRR